MSKEMTDELLLSYLEGTLPEDERSAVAEQLAGSAELAQRLEQLQMLLDTMEHTVEAEPPAASAWQFKVALQEEMDRSAPTGSWGWRVAATVTLLVLGFAVGRLSISKTSDDQLIAMQAQLSELQQTVMQTTLQSPSASERIRAVNLIEEEVAVPSEELLKTLINTVKGDESPNVRYAALEALEPFMNSESVRLELVAALETQSDPILQIAIINWLVEAEEQAAISTIKKLIENENTSQEVKQQGQLAIDILI
ncbi:MAG: hypothetical protein AAGA85_22225 [Bacteroidota bacterium]